MSTILRQEPGGHLIFLVDDESVIIADYASPDWAQRITACTNACAGIETQKIEDHKVTVCGKSYIELEQQRDKLLSDFKEARATLEKANEIGQHTTICDVIWHTNSETLFDFMDESIAEIEATK